MRGKRRGKKSDRKKNGLFQGLNSCQDLKKGMEKKEEEKKQ